MPSLDSCSQPHAPADCASLTRKVPHCVFLDFCENAVEGIFQSTPEGHYLMVNRSLARMYGYDSPAHLMASVNSIKDEIYADPSVRDEFERRIERDGFVSALEYQIKRRDGSLVWISEFSRAVRGPSGVVLHYEGSIQDISARKRAEEERASMEHQLRQTFKMEAIGTLAGGIAHDFNNLLAVIQGFSQLALEDKGLSRQGREYLTEALVATSKAADLVKQILAFSRKNDTGRSSLRLKTLVLEIQRLLCAGLPSKVVWEGGFEAAQDHVLANPTQLHQVLLNLCTNASYAMRKRGGRLEVTVSDWMAPPPEELPEGHYLELRIRDEGEGMSPQTMERIFDPFFTTKPRGEGTGLGLSVAMGIVRSHGGTILVESRPGEGSCFRVLLPRAEPQRAAASIDKAPAVTPKGRGRILCVDDDESVLRMLQIKLRQCGYRVLTRADSSEALRTIQDNPDDYDLLLTDLNMPGMNGTDLSRRVRRLRPDMPVILCSGQVELLPQHELSECGISCLIPKPVDIAMLGAAIEKTVAGARGPAASAA